jgi:acetyl-CoA carboxylase biotin carboxyl carrier protein
MAESAGKQRSGKSTVAAVEQNGRSEDAGDLAQSMTDLEFLRGLIEAVDQSGIDSLELARGGTRIRIGKTPAGAAMRPTYMPQMPPMQGYPQPVPPHMAPAQHHGEHHPAQQASAPSSASAPAAAAPPKSNYAEVKSPMVGTFYRAPAPEAPPYVEIGSIVSKGQTLCILEAMKLMNELECEVDGIVREILIEDTEPVEYGQVLFRIEPTGSK